MGAVVRARDDGHLRATRLRKNDQPVWVRAHALVPDRLVSAPLNDLGLLNARVPKRTADHERAVPGESLHEDSGKLADHRTTWQLANERRRAAVGVASELLGDVLTIVAGHDPRQRIGIASLIHHTAIGKGDHAHAPCVTGRLADHHRPVGHDAAGNQYRHLICSRGKTDGSDADPRAVNSEHVKVIGTRWRRRHTAERSSIIGPHHVLVDGNQANRLAVRVVNRTGASGCVGPAPEK